MVVKILLELVTEILRTIYRAIKSIFARRMTFLKTLKKGDYTIYVYALPYDRYMIEYSNDGFGSKERKEYNSKDELMEVLQRRFPISDLSFL